MKIYKGILTDRSCEFLKELYGKESYYFFSSTNYIGADSGSGQIFRADQIEIVGEIDLDDKKDAVSFPSLIDVIGAKPSKIEIIF